ncbi:hypothetical protein ACIBKY_12200 [Nonomuraea sp. NPDC050394]|uniref:hypothetical protein n=1 Tax=Nonomuraea sp. NPDC050394 TaxID=3364363 RepID=UPI00378E120D
MIGFASAPHARLITGVRLAADCLDALPDGWLPEVAATVLLLTAVMLHMIAEVLQNCSDLAEGK